MPDGLPPGIDLTNSPIRHTDAHINLEEIALDAGNNRHVLKRTGEIVGVTFLGESVSSFFHYPLHGMPHCRAELDGETFELQKMEAVIKAKESRMGIEKGNYMASGFLCQIEGSSLGQTYHIQLVRYEKHP